MNYLQERRMKLFGIFYIRSRRGGEMSTYNLEMHESNNFKVSTNAVDGLMFYISTVLNVARLKTNN